MAARRSPGGRVFPVRAVPVDRIRPEEGLGRKRDRDGHAELKRSIQRFGVLTPITVRPAPDGSGDFLLVKGQGRTLACRLLGMVEIPAVVVDDRYADDEKVQQFLVENVARLKMRPIDRALLIHRAREAGEETASIAKRFGLAPTTVRRLLVQLDGASSGEVAVLRAGKISLATHAVVARYVDSTERDAILELVVHSDIKSKELEELFVALGWRQLAAMGVKFSSQRLVLFSWACQSLAAEAKGSTRERFSRVAVQLPAAFERDGSLWLEATR